MQPMAGHRSKILSIADMMLQSIEFMTTYTNKDIPQLSIDFHEEK